MIDSTDTRTVLFSCAGVIDGYIQVFSAPRPILKD